MLWTVKAIGEFLAADKTLAGDGFWVCDPNEDQCRLRYTIEVEGVPTASTFEIIDFPLTEPRTFTITLNLPPCIWRLDYDPPSKIHVNDVPEMHECPRLVRGPHYHPWHLNAKFHGGRNAPQELPLALPYTARTRTFKAALDWFCDQTRITFAKNQLPALPPRGRLL
jgi:hypothetical protein